MRGTSVRRSDVVVLERMALLFLRNLRRGHPRWRMADALRQLSLRPSELACGLLMKAGFVDGFPSSRNRENAVLRAVRRGARSAGSVAEQTGIPLGDVEAIVAEVGMPFGADGYGSFPWPGKASPGSAVPEPRRVSAKGQLSYRGRLYCLGAEYAGSVGWVVVEGRKLRVIFARKPPVTLYTPR